MYTFASGLIVFSSSELVPKSCVLLQLGLLLLSALSLRAAWRLLPALVPALGRGGVRVERVVAPVAGGFAYTFNVSLSSPYWYYEAVSVLCHWVLRSLLEAAAASLRYGLLQEQCQLVSHLLFSFFKVHLNSLQVAFSSK